MERGPAVAVVFGHATSCGQPAEEPGKSPDVPCLHPLFLTLHTVALAPGKLVCLPAGTPSTGPLG